MEADTSHARPGEISDEDAGRILEMLASIGQSLDDMRESVAAMRASMLDGATGSGRAPTPSEGLASYAEGLKELLRGLLGDVQELGAEVRECRELLQSVDGKLSSLAGLHPSPNDGG